MSEPVKKTINEAEPVVHTAATVVKLESKLAEADAAAEAARSAYAVASCDLTEGRTGAEIALARSKGELGDALVARSDIDAALAEARKRHAAAIAAEAAKAAQAQRAKVAKLADKRKAAAKALQMQAESYAAAYHTFMEVSAAFADALPGKVRGREIVRVSPNHSATRAALGLRALEITWAYKIPTSALTLKPFFETIVNDTDELANLVL